MLKKYAFRWTTTGSGVLYAHKPMEEVCFFQRYATLI